MRCRQRPGARPSDETSANAIRARRITGNPVASPMRYAVMSRPCTDLPMTRVSVTNDDASDVVVAGIVVVVVVVAAVVVLAVVVVVEVAAGSGVVTAVVADEAVVD